MNSLDSISLAPDGFLDMDHFLDGSELPELDLNSLRDLLVSDPVDEMADDEWAALVDTVVDPDEEVPADEGPFSIEEDPSFAGVRSVEVDGGGRDGDGPVIEDTTDGDRAGDGGGLSGIGGLDDEGAGIDGSSSDLFVDADGGLDPTNLVGLDLSQDLGGDDLAPVDDLSDDLGGDDGGSFDLGSIF